jgi:hypothetical protein
MFAALVCMLGLTAAAPRDVAPAHEVTVGFDLSNGTGEYTEEFLLPSDQRVQLEHGGVTSVGELHPRDRVRLESGRFGTITRADRYSGAPSKQNRVVGRVRRLTRDFLLLQTPAELIETTPEHPFFVSGRGWVEAGKLHRGDRVATDRPEHTVEIASVERRTTAEAKPVFNLMIEGSHVYHVGREHLLVHNTQGRCGDKPAGVGEEELLPQRDDEPPETVREPPIVTSAPEWGQAVDKRILGYRQDWACNTGNCHGRAMFASYHQQEFGLGGVLVFKQEIGNLLYPSTKFNHMMKPRNGLNPLEVGPWGFHAVNVEITPNGAVLHDIDQWRRVSGPTLEAAVSSYVSEMFPRQNVRYSHIGHDLGRFTPQALEAMPGEAGALNWTTVPR